MKPNGKPEQKWPGAKLWPLAKIKPYPHNPRVHPEEQIALLAAALAEHGPDQPIVVDEAGVILKGHGRLAAAERAGLAAFPVVQRAGLTDAQKSQIRIIDNKLAELSAWDRGLLRVEIEGLRALDFDIASLGFAENELDALLKDVEPPADFAAYSENLAVDHQCPKCGSRSRSSLVPRRAHGLLRDVNEIPAIEQATDPEESPKRIAERGEDHHDARQDQRGADDARQESLHHVSLH